MTQKSIWKTAALPVLLIFILAGCATTIQLSVQRPPKLNTTGIKRVAIMPFEADSGDYREMAQYAATVATDKIQATGYFTLVDPSTVQNLQRNNQSVESYVDALFRGRVTRIVTTQSAQEGSYKNRDGQTVTYTDYSTNVEIEFTYSLTRARDGSLIGPVLIKGSENRSSRENYPAAVELLRAAIDRELRYLGRDLAPHTVMESRTLVKDKSKDKVLQEEMKNALAQVKARNYRAALEAYLGIYRR
jgi:hypothetical protein